MKIITKTLIVKVLIAKNGDYACAKCSFYRDNECPADLCSGPGVPVEAYLKVVKSTKEIEVRGLLCNNCNTALGMLKDSPIVLQSALDYLKEVGHYGVA